MTPVALTIAGSDSGGGAGIQADLRTFAQHGVFGTSAITAVTAQNLDGVTRVHALPVADVVAQVDAVVRGFSVAAVKTGMLWSRAIVSAIASLASRGQLPSLVVDPVMVATSGARLLSDEAVRTYTHELFPHATLVTPNLLEAEAFLAGAITDISSLRRAARALCDAWHCAVLLKGGHLAGEPVDVLSHPDGSDAIFEHSLISDVVTHGTGCTLSAAITANLAHGRDLQTAVRDGINYVHAALTHASTLASGTRVLRATMF